MMMYKVTLEMYEYIEADSAKEAQQKFRDNFEWADIDHGTYQVEPDTRESWGSGGLPLNQSNLKRK